MQINQEYLVRFSTQIRGKPAEIPLNGYEQPAQYIISIDDADGTQLGVSYRDDYPENAPWDVKEGTDKRETFVIVSRGVQTVGSVGYRFAGLISLTDLRAWYRRKFEVKDAAGST